MKNGNSFNEPAYLRASQLAKRCSVSIRTVHRWTESGVVPCVKIGHRTVLFDVAAVDQALARFSVQEVGA